MLGAKPRVLHMLGEGSAELNPHPLALCSSSECHAQSRLWLKITFMLWKNYLPPSLFQNFDSHQGFNWQTLYQELHILLD